MSPRSQRPIIATYRLQLTPSFGFDRAVELIDPLTRFGVSHLYLSPVAEAVTGSEHGYDVVDPRVVRTEFGGEVGLSNLLDAAEASGLGIIIDHVPNHVSVARAELNPFWWAALREGPESEAAAWFDIDWEFAGGRVIVPRLGEPLPEVLAAGGISVGSGERGDELRYGPLTFPIAEGTADLPLDELVAAQHYELSWWRDERRNVRRFFTIDDLVAVRVEDEAVRSVIDSLPARLSEHPAFDGVRVDHVDGLADPGRYLEQLRSTIGDRWLLVEKILGHGETLPSHWQTDGTTGYEHVTLTEHLLLDDADLPPLDAFWVELAAGSEPPSAHRFAAIEDRARREVLDAGLRPDLDRLVRTVETESSSDRHVLTMVDVRTAIIELTVRLHRYRTYLPDDPTSRDVLSDLVDRTVADCPEQEASIRWFGALVERSEPVRTRWQQLTGPAMAKGAEDCAFYRHQRLSSLCEVGGDPALWAIGVEEFHARQLTVQRGWPTTMLASTTHDTKRSSGVRARSLAMASRADTFVAEARAWMAAHPTVVAELRPADVSLAIQTVLTSWPIDVDRLEAYLVKGCREAQQDTTWIDPDAAYEGALHRLAERLVADMADSASGLWAFGHSLAEPGSQIGLRLAVLQATCPGVPDLYQGEPLELLSLVDPDNRRSPDWDRVRSVVNEATAVDTAEALRRGDLELARAAAVHRLLDLRHRRPSAFGPDAGYRPVEVAGPAEGSVVAFQRFAPGESAGNVVTVVVLCAPVSDADLADSSIATANERWTSVLDGSSVEAPAGNLPLGPLLGATGAAVLETDG